MKFTVNTIQDIQGNKLVLTDENGTSKVWFGQFVKKKEVRKYRQRNKELNKSSL